jgi:hypothetical protein
VCVCVCVPKLTQHDNDGDAEVKITRIMMIMARVFITLPSFSTMIMVVMMVTKVTGMES